MHHSFSDKFADLDTPLSRLPIKFKIIFCLSFVFLIAVTPIQLSSLFWIYGLLLALLIFLSRIPLLFLLKRMATILPFLILVAISIPFIHKNGWVIFTSCLIRAALIILSLILLIQTTRFSKLLDALNGLKVPQLIIMLLSFMYRYLFVLEDQILRKKRALDARSAGMQGWQALKSTANMAGSIFIHTYERAERVYLAMCARGYNNSQE
ncbi:MAG: cobalt ECF transporter T component CbiQ [Candidatus Omnitrophica bacterium]|nr:cobalt ECF transporter T component CbiQ [Candidatus Omnitrophota bacterium]